MTKDQATAFLHALDRWLDARENKRNHCGPSTSESTVFLCKREYDDAGVELARALLPIETAELELEPELEGEDGEGEDDDDDR